MSSTNALGIIVPCTITAILYTICQWIALNKAKRRELNDLELQLSDVLQQIQKITAPNIKSYFIFNAIRISRQLGITLEAGLKNDHTVVPLTTSLADDIDANITKLYANTSPYKFEDLVNDNFTLNFDYIRREINDVLKEVVPQWQSKLVHTVNEEPQFNILRDKLIDMMVAIDIHMKNTDNNKNFKNILASQIHIDSVVLTKLYQWYETKNYFIAISQLSGYTERWLGDIAYSSNQKAKIPKKLSELLALPALRKIIGDLNALLVHMVLGPPPGLNVRNLVWHGFIHENEVPSAIIPFILILLISTANQLPSDFKYQQRVLDLSLPSEKPAKSLYNGPLSRLFSANIDIKDYEHMILSSNFVFPGHRQLWIQALNLYKNENYYDYLLLGFPILEQSIRRIWVSVNNIESHYLYAETHTIMTTMEDILAERVDFWYNGQPEGPYRDMMLNRLPSELGRHITLIMMDLFTAKRSPKIRDLMAHGAINNEIDVRWAADRIFAVSMSLIAKYSLNDYCALISKSSDFVRRYRSKFHPFAKVIDELRNSYITCLELLYRHPAAKYRLYAHDKITQSVNNWIWRIRDQLPRRIVGCLYEDFNGDEWKIESYWRNFDYRLYYSNEEEIVLESLCSISEALSSFVNTVLGSYEMLNSKVYRRTAWKQQRTLFKKLQDEGVPMTLLIAQVYALIIEDQIIQLCPFKNESGSVVATPSTSGQLSTDFFEICVKTMGILNTSVSAGHFGKLKPILLALHGIPDTSQSVLSRREMSLILNALNVLK